MSSFSQAGGRYRHWLRYLALPLALLAAVWPLTALADPGTYPLLTSSVWSGLSPQIVLVVVAIVLSISSCIDAWLHKDSTYLLFTGFILSLSLWVVIFSGEHGADLRYWLCMLAQALASILIILLCRSCLDLPAHAYGLNRISIYLAILTGIIALPAILFSGMLGLMLVMSVCALSLFLTFVICVTLLKVRFAEAIWSGFAVLLLMLADMAAMVSLLQTNSFLPEKQSVFLVLTTFLCMAIAVAHRRGQMQEEAILALQQMFLEQLGKVQFLESTEQVLNRRLEQRESKLDSLSRQLAEHVKRGRLLSRRLSENEDLLKQFAYHDALTGLPNRLLFADRLERTLDEETAPAASGMIAILLLDLDDFGRINSRKGPRYGDRVLAALAKRLQQLLPPDTCLARFGGDEFAIMLHPLASQDVGRLLARTLIQDLAVPLDVEGEKLVLSCSVGMSVFPVDGRDLDALIQQAEGALYRAKSTGTGALVCASGDEVNPGHFVREA
ncbi:GGDEF domain-containing protein [Leeia oryzae]|uniref:GGDEF domain-containing protein n=1 Tax=Leeia oryzae TaxID=356662 RepID=UPI000368E236|nr:GGDEF domain-containing protein [Leeia oryzae]